MLAIQPICALAFIFDGMFKGLSKVSYLRNVLLFSTFVIFIPLLFGLNYLGYGFNSIFIAFALWMVARGIPLIIKFRKMYLPRT